jgi:Holliday junction resolvasome RuvABC ATP-dependent DNA helicase subunit
MNQYKKDNSDLENLIVSSIKEGSEKRFEDLEGIFSKNPLSLLNPEEELTEESIDLFVGREAEIKVISQLIGTYKNLEKNIHVALVGSIGCGKRTTMKIITSIIEKTFPDITYEIYDSPKSVENKRINVIDFGETGDYAELKTINENKVDIQIISCLKEKPNHIIFNINSLNDAKITFSILNIYHYTPKLKEIFDKTIIFNKFGAKELQEILMKRVEQTLIDKTKLQFMKEIIEKISNISKGNLKVSFLMFDRISQLLEFEANEPMDRVLKHFAELFAVKLTNNEERILNCYMESCFGNKNEYITTTHLIQLLGFDNSNVWKYITNLVKKGVFIEHVHGNPSTYVISKDFLLIYEDWKRKEIINY